MNSKSLSVDRLFTVIELKLKGAGEPNRLGLTVKRFRYSPL